MLELLLRGWIWIKLKARRFKPTKKYLAKRIKTPYDYLILSLA